MSIKYFLQYDVYGIKFNEKSHYVKLKLLCIYFTISNSKLVFLVPRKYAEISFFKLF